MLSILLFTLLSCGIQQEIKDYSYTNEFYYLDVVKYQVYKTKSGKKYIIVNNKKFYIEKRKCKVFNEPFNYVIW